MDSVISFPDRGNWGKSSWRGNCSGHVIKALIEHFRPSLFVDVCEGSGTSRDVCREMKVDYVGFDLHGTQSRALATDFTRDCIRLLLPRPADVCFSHPPYFNMIDYRQVGEFNDPGAKASDLSATDDVNEFLEKSQLMLMNQREATRPGGIYASLIGDMRKGGVFRSFQADYISMMPCSELCSVVIKTQHNTVSDRKTYGGTFVPIRHEYLLIWKRADKTLVQVSLEKAMELTATKTFTWRNIIRSVIMAMGGEATTADVVKEVEKQMPGYVAERPHWQAKVRQQLHFHAENVSRGLWSVPEMQRAA